MNRRALLILGIVSPLIFAVTDTFAGLSWQGYSFTAQAVSELFAIGAPPAQYVIPIFTVSSILVLGFSYGVWMSANGNRWVKLTALMFIGNAVNGLILWNVFPMHLRGAETSFTDLMHIVLAGVGVVFVLGAVCIVAIYSRERLRLYSLAAILVLLIPGAFVFMTIPGLTMGEPTPYVGLTERVSTYGYYVWQAIYIRYLMSQGTI